jgi:hypothetical protein
MDNIQMSGTNHTNTTVTISAWYTTEPAILRAGRRTVALPPALRDTTGAVELSI